MPHKCQECGWEHTTPDEDIEAYVKAISEGLKSDDPMVRYFAQYALDKELQRINSPLFRPGDEGKTINWSRFKNPVDPES